MNIPCLPVMAFKFSNIPPWELPVVNFCKYLSNLKKKFTHLDLHNLFLAHAETHQQSICIFTDGSKSDAGIGFGVYHRDFYRKGVLPPTASSFTAELHGILTALEIIASHPSKNFTIFSHSKSVLQSIHHFNSKHPLVLKILEWLYLIIQRGCAVSFCWVPAHVGIFLMRKLTN